MAKRRRNKRKPLQKKLQDWKAAWKIFVFHKIPARRKKLKSWWARQRKDIKRWKRDRPAMKRVREAERAKASKRLNKKIKSSPKKFRTAVSRSITRMRFAIRKSIRNSIKEYKHLRKLSWRENIAICWKLYLQLIAFVLSIPSRIYRSWKRLKPLERTVSAVALVAAVALLASSAFLWGSVKEWRSQQLISEAKELADQERKMQAYLKSRTAALLDPDEKGVLEETLKLANDVRTGETIWWSEKVAEKNNLDIESVTDVIDYSLDYRQFNKGAQYLAVLKNKFPESESIVDSELRMLREKGYHEQALAKAMESIDDGVDSPAVHQTYVELALTSSDPAIQTQAVNHLEKCLQRGDETAMLMARIALLLEPELVELAQLDYQKIYQLVSENPHADREDRVSSISRALLEGAITPEDAQTAIIAEFDLSDDKSYEEALSALSTCGIYEGRDDFIPKAYRKINPKLASAYIEGIVFSESPDLDRAEAIIDGKTDDQLALTETHRRFWRAIIANEREESERFQVYLLQSLEKSTIEDWDYMHVLLMKHVNPEQRLAFYREIYGRGDAPRIASSHYLTNCYFLGQEDELTGLIKQLQSERFYDQPASANFLLYLKSLYDIDLELSRFQAEELVSKYPLSAPLRRTLAFIYYRTGETQLAQALLAELPELGPGSPGYLHLMNALILGSQSQLPSEDRLYLEVEKQLARNLTTMSSSLEM
ncbi:MAG: hypothetical protein AAFX93_05280 [Verrucomicrobiota bacterium]